MRLLLILLLCPLLGLSQYNGLVVLDFGGESVHNNDWALEGNWVAPPSKITYLDRLNILKKVRNDFSMFKILVTLDSASYWGSFRYKAKVVISYGIGSHFPGQSASTFIGTIYRDTSLYPNNTLQSFVAEDLLGYNITSISRATTHEIGHQFGLFHNSVFPTSGDTCIPSSTYYNGAGSGNFAWAPIMGNNFTKPVTLWYTGKTPTNCAPGGNCACTLNSLNMLGNGYIAFLPEWIGMKFKPDDCPSTLSSAKWVSGSKTGVLEVPSDEDFYKVQTKGRDTHVSLVSYGMADFAIDVYNQSGSFISTLDDASDIHIPDTEFTSQTLLYFKVRTSNNVTGIPKDNSCGRYDLNITFE